MPVAALESTVGAAVSWAWPGTTNRFVLRIRLSRPTDRNLGSRGYECLLRPVHCRPSTRPAELAFSSLAPRSLPSCGRVRGGTQVASLVKRREPAVIRRTYLLASLPQPSGAHSSRSRTVLADFAAPLQSLKSGHALPSSMPADSDQAAER